MQFMQVAYGLATSTEVAYFTYIYAKVPGEFYQQVTSFTRASLLLGKFISGVLSQILISLDLLDYRGLNYISLTMVSIAAFSSFFLPIVEATIYFHRNDSNVKSVGQEDSTKKDQSKSDKGKISKAFGFIWNDFITSFSDPYILKWSIWWALGTCGNYQVHINGQITCSNTLNHRLVTTYSHCGKKSSLWRKAKKVSYSTVE